MTDKRFRVHEWVKYNYSEIGEYIDENHTDRPIRNDEVVELLNELHEENEQLKSFIKSLASHDGKIWLSSGYVYRIDKILNDFNNTENDDGDVE